MSTSQTIKYKTCLDVIYHYTLRDGARLSKDEIDRTIKTMAEMIGTIRDSSSTSEMNGDEKDQLIECAYFFASQIGCELKETGTEKIKLNFNRE